MKKLRCMVAAAFAVAVPIQANNLQGQLNDFSQALGLLSQAVQRSAGQSSTAQGKGGPKTTGGPRSAISAAELQARATELTHVEPSEKPESSQLKRNPLLSDIEKGSNLQSASMRALERDLKRKEKEVKLEQRKILIAQIMAELNSYKITPEDLEILVDQNFMPEETLDDLAKKLAGFNEKDRRNFYSNTLPMIREKALDRKVENLDLTPDELNELQKQGIIETATKQALMNKLSTIGNQRRDEFFERISSIKNEAKKQASKSESESYWESFKNVAMDTFYRKFPGLEE